MEAAVDTPYSFTQALSAADAAVSAGNLPVARANYEKALAIDPASIDASVGLEYLDYLESNRKSRYSGIDLSKHAEVDREAKEANLALLHEEFERKKTRLQARPSSVFLEHTTKCNFYCPHCSKGYDPYYAGDMSKEVTDRALDTLLPSMTWACITGFGEPTIGSQYQYIMQRLLENDVVAHYSTNTSTLTLPHIEMLVKSGAKIILSIDGATKETFETIRAGGDWEKLQRSLHAIRRLRAIYGGDSHFGVTFVAMQTNVHELPLMVRMVHEFGLTFLKVHDYHAFGEDYDENTLRNAPEVANRFFDEAEKLAQELGVSLVLPPRYTVAVSARPQESLWQKVIKSRRIFPKRNRFPQRCDMPWKFTQIGVDGEVTPCCYSIRELGNLNEQSFDEIWNGFKYRFFRWRIETAVPPIECRECHVYEGISKGNPGNTMLEEGLIVKAIYFLERRIVGWWLRRRKPKVAESKEPNYYQGKHWKPIATISSGSSNGSTPCGQK
jgi:radical SAM protein with 4Fe4S-binding SPASM domain